MQTANVLGSTHATIKHSSLTGRRLVIVQPLGVGNDSDGPPLLVVDSLGTRKGDRVIICSDGSYAREVTGHEQTPARWTVMGICDD
ncbi:EutN/CcmL family microcompartment protein [Crateriforma conspicua]|uniref:Ethanolamine utilization protein EutN n=1 Tax=Crateriforma conspicua TaxID=2527996 RepID=A0A5C6FMH1_9PLAN|nr:EutN/CcmL family microcompartment protein [Crateriforma conspicua]TWU63237.1 Ethanolamine utilization protein EutN [Crateriforma conspicua]